MGSCRSWRVLTAAVGVTLAACATGSAGEGGIETAASPAGADERAPAGDADGSAEGEPSVDEVLAAIAAQDLTPEERLEYLHERAVEEGEILVYSSSHVGINEAWVDGFRAAYPDVGSRFVRGQNPELFERLRAEARAGRHVVDVVQISASVGAVLQGDGLLARHHGVPIPEDYPSEYVEDFAAVVWLAPVLIAWNTDLVAPDAAPREHDDLLAPQHSGCVMNNAPTPIATMIAERGYDATETWLQGFIDNGGIAQVIRSTAVLGSVAAAEFDCAVNATGHAVEAMIVDDGAPLEWHAPDPTPVIASSIYIHGHTSRPHAAALFMHWMLSEEGARVVADDGRLPPYPDVPVRYERLRPFVEPGSELAGRLRHLTAEELTEVGDQSFELLERYFATGPAS